MPAKLVTVAAAVAVLAVVAVVVSRRGEVGLGPVDGYDLAWTDLDRVRVGSVAPDFALRSLQGDVIRLSDYRGSHNVVLAFYRGHW